MPAFLVHATFIFFTITAVSGLWMRLFPFLAEPTFTYTNVLHGHSHLALLGWTFLGAFVLFIGLAWKQLTAKREAVAIAITLFIGTLAMFAAFIYQGYALYSIIFSTIHIFIEYWAAIFIYRHCKTMNKHSRLYVKGALLSLIISSIGPFALGYISATGLKETKFFDMAIYFYLHFQYNGWLTFILIGSFIAFLYSKKIRVKPAYLTAGFWLYLIALLPSYLSSVLWALPEPIVHTIATIGVLIQWLAVILMIVGMSPMWKQLRGKLPKTIHLLLMVTTLLLLVKSTMELGLAIPQLTGLIYDTRSIVVGYLHFTLLGFVSIFILVQFQLIGLLPMNRISSIASYIFLFGFLANEALLFGQGLCTWLGLPTIPYYLHGLIIASLLLLVGIVLFWIAFLERKKTINVIE
ncbi:hypothetical protein DX933_06125 [Ornithinibacillus gellani]|uniref:hypothetical protein n=1 Tax=Ornithinibacillus gellani TaxID=2293253 RepID=UPI000F4ABCC4|nr:hypothetical protein [Ornithinibacillus gellani]TQS75841.1 hypothetical protein DX933_06125 [Ornithinibacillus gellani]